jgi:hypothetical protein
MQDYSFCRERYMGVQSQNSDIVLYSFSDNNEIIYLKNYILQSVQVQCHTLLQASQA